jgi:hypothetical protein
MNKDKAVSSIHYLNTDLDIESESDLRPIIEAFGEDVIVMHHGEERGLQIAHFEIAGWSTNADETIQSFCDLVENFGKNARAIWDSCCTRILDIGYECGSSPYNYRSEIKPDTIKRVAGIGASLVITIYSPLKEKATCKARQQSDKTKP